MKSITQKYRSYTTYTTYVIQGIALAIAAWFGTLLAFGGWQILGGQ